MATIPVMKAEVPDAIPASIAIASAGLATMSFKIVPPAGTEGYNSLTKEVPITNRIGISIARPNDHLPASETGRNWNFIVCWPKSRRSRLYHPILSNPKRGCERGGGDYLDPVVARGQGFLLRPRSERTFAWHELGGQICFCDPLYPQRVSPIAPNCTRWRGSVKMAVQVPPPVANKERKYGPSTVFR